MKREEADSLVVRVQTLWNRPSSPTERKLLQDAWWPFLEGVGADEARDAVDEIIVRGDRFPPTVGEVRRIALKPLNPPPAPLVAWTQFQDRLKAATAGVSLPEVHDLVLQTMKTIGGGNGMHTNGDRDAFLAAYGHAVAHWENEHYKVRR